MRASPWVVTVPPRGGKLSKADIHRYWNERGEKPSYIPLMPHDYTGSPAMVYYYSARLIVKVEQLIQRFFSRRPITDTIVAFDMAGGLGRIAVNLAGTDPRLVFHLLDISEVMVERAQAHAKAWGVSERVICQVGAIEDQLCHPTYQAEQFQLVIAGAIFLHLVEKEELKKAVALAMKVLVPGGMLIVFETMLDNNPKYQSLKDGLKHGLTRYRWLADFDSLLAPCVRQVSTTIRYCDETMTIAVFQKPYTS
jgi:SAM-dependent methyltransferase